MHFICVIQLFKKPHPPKRVRSKSNGDIVSVPPSSNSDKIFFHHLDNLRPSLAPVKGTKTEWNTTPRNDAWPVNVALTHLLLLLFLELKEPVGQIVCTDKGILAVEQNKVLVPPTWSKTFAWGYTDLSCRLANYDSDKVEPHC